MARIKSDTLLWSAVNSSIQPGLKKNGQDVIVEGNRAIRVITAIVHRFRLIPIDDPIVEAADPILKWEHSEAGQWVMARSVEKPVWHQNSRLDTWETEFIITARLRETDYTFWVLKWGSLDNSPGP